MARVTLTEPGEDVDVGGDLTVIGTRSGGEVITVRHGTVFLDSSFNAGGDTVRLLEDAAFFTVRLVGSTAVIVGVGVTVTIPVGTAGLAVAFNDTTRTLIYDLASSSVKLGEQTITATQANVVPAGGAPSLAGTEGPDVITGTSGDDVIDGLGGADRIDGGAGNDILRGGGGGDDINGGFGNDQLFGGAGDDRVYDDYGASTLLDGGTGNDYLSIINLTGTDFRIVGGDGDDYVEVEVGSSGLLTVDAGAGQDRVMIDSNGMPVSVTLGAGRDQLVLAETALSSPRFGPITVTDFQPGQAGDTVEFMRALIFAASSWDQNGNPFTSGFVRIIERDGSAVMQFDRDGAASTLNNFRDVITFSGIGTAALTKENFEGLDPAPISSQRTFGAVFETFAELPAHVWAHAAFA